MAYDDSPPFAADGYSNLTLEQAVDELVQLLEVIKFEPSAESVAEALTRLVSLSAAEGVHWVVPGGAMRGLNEYILSLESDLSRSSKAISYWQDRALKIESTLSAKPGRHGGH